MLKASILFMAIMAALAGSVNAREWLVPEWFPQGIQSAISDTAVHDGDTVSVWGPPAGQPSVPPRTYYENIDFLGKSILVVNRSFLPGATSYDSSWDHVVIDGQQLGTVVTMTGSADAVLMGFTIQHGHTSGYGGGVNCNEGSILKNHILYNCATSGGGGVYYSYWHWEIGDCWIDDNRIENNSAPGGGGGIFVVATDCDIRRNVVRNDTTVNCGGGILLGYYDPWQDGPFPTPDTNITGNVVDSNHLTGADPKGGGIFAQDWTQAARRNVVTDNDSNGVYVCVHHEGPLDMGDADDPGLNVLMRNGSHDLVVDDAGQDQVHAVGDYWGYLDTHTIRGRILFDPPNDVLYDPVATSSRWFDVDLEPLSTCSTGVLVTGELSVTRSLTIAEGETLVFYHTADTPLSFLTELDVTGSGTVLTSAGTADHPVLYVPQRAMDPLRADEWIGIRVLSSAHAQFAWSDIRHAHYGLDVEPDGQAEVTDSRLDSCLYAGASCQSGALDVDLSDVSCNGVYGVRYQTNDELNHCGVADCTLKYNGIAGVSIDGPGTSNVLAPNQITANLIDGGGITLRGIEATNSASWTSIEDNQVSACDQAGIALTSSAPGLDGNQVSKCNISGIALTSCSCTLFVHNNQVCTCNVAGIVLQSSSSGVVGNKVQDNGNQGIVCVEGSNPKVRWDTVSGHICGVYCDPTSAPDLGTVEDPGMNSILMDNGYWVVKLANPLHPDSVMAQLNWWGTDDVDSHGLKFQGHVDSFPWLSAPPQGGGQQGAGAVSLRLVTGLDRLQPMPMRSMARIPFQVAHAGQVALSIVDVSGRLVRTLVRGERGAGRYNLTWNRTDDRGRRVPAGVYFCTLSAENKRFCKKVILTE